VDAGGSNPTSSGKPSAVPVVHPETYHVEEAEDEEDHFGDYISVASTPSGELDRGARQLSDDEDPFQDDPQEEEEKDQEHLLPQMPSVPTPDSPLKLLASSSSGGANPPPEPPRPGILGGGGGGGNYHKVLASKQKKFQRQLAAEHEKQSREKIKITIFYIEGKLESHVTMKQPVTLSVGFSVVSLLLVLRIYVIMCCFLFCDHSFFVSGCA
jgi:hypothetical protein